MADNELPYFVNPAGKVVQLSHEDATRADRFGYTPATDDQAKQFENEVSKMMQYGSLDQTAIASIEGFASGASAGFSEKLESALGVDPEAISARAEANPWAHGIGEVAGIVAPAIATGGLTAEAQLAGRAAAAAQAAAGAGRVGQAFAAGRAAAQAMPAAATTVQRLSSLTAPGLAMRAGLGAGAAVEALAPSAAVAAKAIPAVTAALARGATEGATLAGEQALGDVLVGKPDLAGESVMERVKMGALIGGAIGGGMTAGPLVWRAVADATKGTDAWKKFVELSGKYEAEQLFAAAGGTPAEWRGLLSRRGKSQSKVYAIMREARDLGMVSALSRPSNKLNHIEDVIFKSGQTMGEAHAAADSALTDLVRPRLDDIFARFSKGPLQKYLGQATLVPEVNNTIKLMRNLELKYAGKRDFGVQDLHDIKKELADRIYGIDRAANRTVGDDVQAEILDKLRYWFGQEIKETMKSVGIPRESYKVALRQNEVGHELRRLALRSEARMTLASFVPPLLQEAAVLGAGYMVGGPIGVGVSRILADRALGQTWRSPALGWLAGSVRRANGVGAPNYIVSDLKSMAQQQAAALAATAPGPITLSAKDAVRAEYLRLVDTIHTARAAVQNNPNAYPPGTDGELNKIAAQLYRTFKNKKATASQLADSIERAEMIFASRSIPAVGSAAFQKNPSSIYENLRNEFRHSLASAHTPPGAAPEWRWNKQRLNQANRRVAKAAAAISNPQQDLVLDALQQSLKSLQANVQSKASVLTKVYPALKASAPALIPAAVSTQQPILAENILGTAEAKKIQNVTPEVVAKGAVFLMNNPDHMERLLSAVGDDIGYYSPDTAQSMKNTLARAVAFLASKAPQSKPMAPGMPDLEPSYTEKVRFARYLRVINDPLLLIDDVKSGVVTPEEIEAVEAVYPRLFEEIQGELAYVFTAQSADETKPTPMTYKERIALSKILKTDMTGIMKRNLGVSAQSIYGSLKQPPPQRQQQMPVSRAQGLNMSGRAGQETAAWRYAQKDYGR